MDVPQPSAGVTLCYDSLIHGFMASPRLSEGATHEAPQTAQKDVEVEGSMPDWEDHVKCSPFSDFNS